VSTQYQNKIAWYKRLLEHSQLLSLGEIMAGTPGWDIRRWRIAWIYGVVAYKPDGEKFGVFMPSRDGTQRTRTPVRTTEDELDLEIIWQNFLINRLESLEAGRRTCNGAPVNPEVNRIPSTVVT
jgi:hypothetical protein